LQAVAFLQRLQAVVVASSRRAWSRMGADFDASWQQVGPQVTSVVAAGQLAASRRASSYVSDVLAETDQPVPPEARVRPQAFSGVSADGRSLEGLLRASVVRAKSGSASGLSSSLSLDVGQRWLDALVETSMADAFRLTTEAEMTIRPGVGWVRQVNPPCCGRCAILAGRFYAYNQGFKRHPRCDCIHIPTRENVAGSLSTDPTRLFADGQVKGLSERERKRLAAGESPARVINTSRDMWRARVQEQKAAARDAAAQPVTRQAKQSMENLLASAGNRTQAMEFMRRFGYIE
jgi:hypothetical protein